MGIEDDCVERVATFTDVIWVRRSRIVTLPPHVATIQLAVVRSDRYWPILLIANICGYQVEIRGREMSMFGTLAQELSFSQRTVMLLLTRFIVQHEKRRQRPHAVLVDRCDQLLPKPKAQLAQQINVSLRPI